MRGIFESRRNRIHGFRICFSWLLIELLTAVAHQWTHHATGQRVGNLVLALGVYGAALAVGGNGFITAFVGGLAFGAATRYRLGEATEFTEEVGTVLSTFVWIIFGATLVVPLLRAFDVRAFVFAVLALTMARMGPVAIAMIGSGSATGHGAGDGLVRATGAGVGRLHADRRRGPARVGAGGGHARRDGGVDHCLECALARA